MRGEIALHEPPLVMAALPPRIGKVEMVRVYARIAYEARSDERRVGAQHAHVRLRRARQARFDPAHPTRLVLDAEQIPLRMLARVFDEECAFAATDLDLDGAFVAEERAPVELGL